MAAKKKAKKPLARKAMKKTRGGMYDAFLKITGVEGESARSPGYTGTVRFTSSDPV